ncbi:translation factor [Mariprofundus sp. NF]|nr:translation factor [Mariprofundus sp. NF]
MAALRAAALLHRGGIIAHYTHTLPGVAANPQSAKAVNRLVRFKQRQGPFLLLADSVQRACGLIRFYSPELRRVIRSSWPGPFTLIISAKPGLSAVCYRKSTVAVRVDASLQTRQLAAACGGFLLSSSLNRRGGTTAEPSRKLCMRWHRHLDAVLQGPASTGKASVLLRVWRNDSTTIRP